MKNGGAAGAARVGMKKLQRQGNAVQATEHSTPARLNVDGNGARRDAFDRYPGIFTASPKQGSQGHWHGRGAGVARAIQDLL
eukprot:gene8459-biopygen93